jgi:hypothetical protein
VRNGRYAEYIPQLRAVTKSETELAGDTLRAPTTPGLGIDWDDDRLDDLCVAAA